MRSEEKTVQETVLKVSRLKDGGGGGAPRPWSRDSPAAHGRPMVQQVYLPVENPV